MDRSTQPADARGAAPATPGFRINEDWAATAVGLLLILLVLGGVIVKGMIP